MADCVLHDETVEWIEKNEVGIESLESMTGTGAFRVPDPESGALKRRTVLVPGLTYGEARLRAVECVDAAWIPEEMHSYEDLQASIAKSRCAGNRCRSTVNCPLAGGCTFCDFYVCVP